MRWTDTNDIAIELAETYPDENVLHISFPELWKKVMALPGFEDTADRCNEKILEAIQQAWLEEAEDM